ANQRAASASTAQKLGSGRARPIIVRCSRRIAGAIIETRLREGADAATLERNVRARVCKDRVVTRSGAVSLEGAVRKRGGSVCVNQSPVTLVSGKEREGAAGDRGVLRLKTDVRRQEKITVKTSARRPMETNACTRGPAEHVSFYQRVRSTVHQHIRDRVIPQCVVHHPDVVTHAIVTPAGTDRHPWLNPALTFLVRSRSPVWPSPY